MLKTLHDLTKYSNIVAHLDKLDASGKSAQHEELDMLKVHYGWEGRLGAGHESLVTAF